MSLHDELKAVAAFLKPEKPKKKTGKAPATKKSSTKKSSTKKKKK